MTLAVASTEELAGSRILTNSRLIALRTCQRLHYYRYVKGYRPIVSAHALRFGTLVHHCLEAWSRAEDGEARLAAALDALVAAHADAQRAGEPIDPFDYVRVRVMVVGYHERWVNDGLEWLAVEAPFKMPLRNPATGRPSPLWEIQGKRDADIRDRATGFLHVVERKTASGDIGPGSKYWSKLTLDGQVSIYLDAARAEGRDVRSVFYDVLGKPAIKPYKATPPEERRYTEKATKLKDGTVRPAGSLHANQRERDETPEEFEERLAAYVGEDPNRYFRRGEIVRLEDEVEEARFDIWQLAQQLRESERAGRYPRNPSACERYGRLCEFFAVCAGQGSLDDTTKFRKLTHVHPELDDADETEGA